MTANLDAHCARKAQEIVGLADGKRDKDLENRITDALAVLEEQGIYACYLYLRYQKQTKVWCHLAALLRDPEVGGLLESSNGPDDAQALIALTDDLHKLVLAKQLMQQTLIYARYGLRALPENKKEGDER